MSKNFFTTLGLSILTVLLAACLLFPNPVHASEATTRKILNLGPPPSFPGTSIQKFSHSFIASFNWQGYNPQQGYSLQEIQDHGRLIMEVHAANNDKGQSARFLNRSSISLKGLHTGTYRIASPQIPIANLPHPGVNYIYVRIMLEIRGKTLQHCTKVAGTITRR